MESLLKDLRLSLRQIYRRPAFAATVILTLALAIGANTAIFSFVNTLLIRPFPFADPDQLVEIHSIRGGQPGNISLREILDLQEQVSAIQDIAASTGPAGGYNFSGNAKPEEWKAVLITSNLFSVLGVPLQAGSAWPKLADTNRDDRVIISDAVWRRAFRASRDVVGKRITLDHADGYTVDGVAAVKFDFPRGVEVFRSLGGFATSNARTLRNVVGIARIKRPYGLQRLQSELDAVTGRLQQQFPDTNRGLSFKAVTFRQLYSGQVRPYLLILMVAVGFVLLVACGNVVNLLLSRALDRQRETSVRLALGASRAAIIRQTLTESVLYALIAALLGIGIGYAFMRLLRSIIGDELPSWITVDLDGRVLLFTICLSILAGLASGLAPAVQLSRGKIADSLKEGSRGTAGGVAAGRVRNLMIVGEVAVALILVVGAGLLVSSFNSLLQASKGFDTAQLSTFRVALGWKRYMTQATTAQYYKRALETLSSMPGLEQVAFTSDPPLAGPEGNAPQTIQIEGQSSDAVNENPYVKYESVSPSYFNALKIPLKAGRLFTDFDNDRGEPVCLISERLAKIMWPTSSPVGRKLAYAPGAQRRGTPYPQFMSVAGVVGNVQHETAGSEPALVVYVPYQQRAEGNQYVIARTSMPLPVFSDKAEKAMLSIDPQQSVFDFKTYNSRVLDGVWQLRVSRTVLTMLGVVALALAAIGIYGVMSYIVGQRKREIGIRLALGESPGGIRQLITKQALILGGIGLVLGLVGSISFGKLLSSMITSVSGFSLTTLLLAVAVLLLTTILSAAIPASRAAAISPIEALRDN